MDNIIPPSGCSPRGKHGAQHTLASAAERSRQEGPGVRLGAEGGRGQCMGGASLAGEVWGRGGWDWGAPGSKGSEAGEQTGMLQGSR